jgi:hypothetical protein
MNRYLSKEDVQISNRFMEKCSISNIREMQVITTMREYFTLVMMATIKKTIDSKCWQLCGAKAILVHHW